MCPRHVYELAIHDGRIFAYNRVNLCNRILHVLDQQPEFAGVIKDRLLVGPRIFPWV